MADNRFKYLSQIDSPKDLRKFSVDELKEVCKELRCFLINELSQNPGHFGASLGVVELTVALHYVYNTPDDLLVWDVGHQAYGHKILTGRRDAFNTNRKYKGISGFPKREESIFDAFGVGHSSTSISAALGMSIAAKLQNKDKKVIAVIGDGSLTGGMAFEALNNVSIDNSDILIILNDNKIAIDANVGGLHNYLIKITASETYNKLKRDVWDGLGKLDGFGKRSQRTIQKIGLSTKSFFFKQSNFFEALDIRYFGPIDGHDVEKLTELLEKLSKIPGPKLLHVLTTKGKGYCHAEENQVLFHAPGKFDINTGVQIKPDETNKPPRFQDVFGETVLEMARANDKIVAITPAMISGCSLNLMKSVFPDRVFDVGIAEQHAATFAAGLATQGLIPFCNIYSSFAQRAFDQIIHDVAIQNLSVIFCLDRGGLVGADGATHHGVYDLAFLRSIPNLKIASPLNEIELRNMLFTAQHNLDGPYVIRYPRGNGVLVDWRNKLETIEVGKGQKLIDGTDIAFITIGPIGNDVAKAIEILSKNNISAALYDLRFLKPIDTTLLHEVFRKFTKVITVEDGVKIGGMGSAVTDFMVENNYASSIVKLGIPDYFVEHGTVEELYAECGIDIEGIVKAALEIVVS